MHASGYGLAPLRHHGIVPEKKFLHGGIIAISLGPANRMKSLNSIITSYVHTFMNLTTAVPLCSRRRLSAKAMLLLMSWEKWAKTASHLT